MPTKKLIEPEPARAPRGRGRPPLSEEEETEPMSVRVPASIKSGVEAFAMIHETSASAVVRQACQEYLDRAKEEAKTSSRKKSRKS